MKGVALNLAKAYNKNNHLESLFPERYRVS